MKPRTRYNIARFKDEKLLSNVHLGETEHEKKVNSPPGDETMQKKRQLTITVDLKMFT